MTTPGRIATRSPLRREGPERDFYFDVDYKGVYDEALKQPNKPIYLLDGVNGPVYMDGLWYAAVEGRNRADFIHLDEGTRAPGGARRRDP